jgi:hypothetical protein
MTSGTGDERVQIPRRQESTGSRRAAGLPTGILTCPIRRPVGTTSALPLDSAARSMNSILDDVLLAGHKIGASDVHLKAGLPPLLRVKSISGR